MQWNEFAAYFSIAVSSSTRFNQYVLKLFDVDADFDADIQVIFGLTKYFFDFVNISSH